MSHLDETTLQVYSVLFVLATVVLVITARYFQRRRRGQRAQRQIAGIERIPDWTLQSIESGRPLHLSFGSAGIGEDNAAVALAEAEFFYHVIQRANSSDISPIVSMSSAATIPLGQDTVRRAWQGGEHLSRVQWYPQGLAFAGAITASMSVDDPAAHIMAGGFGPELALMLDSADRRGQGSLAVSDRLEGQAVAYAMADHVLIGEELFAAPSYVSEDGGGHTDAAVLDVWRGLVIMGVTVLLMLNFANQLPLLTWPIVAVVAAILIVLGAISYRRR